MNNWKILGDGIPQVTALKCSNCGQEWMSHYEAREFMGVYLNNLALELIENGKKEEAYILLKIAKEYGCTVSMWNMVVMHLNGKAEDIIQGYILLAELYIKEEHPKGYMNLTKEDKDGVIEQLPEWKREEIEELFKEREAFRKERGFNIKTDGKYSYIGDTCDWIYFEAY